MFSIYLCLKFSCKEQFFLARKYVGRPRNAQAHTKSQSRRRRVIESSARKSIVQTGKLLRTTNKLLFLIIFRRKQSAVRPQLVTHRYTFSRLLKVGPRSSPFSSRETASVVCLSKLNKKKIECEEEKVLNFAQLHHINRRKSEKIP